MKLRIQKIIPNKPIPNSTNTLLSLIHPLLKNLQSVKKTKQANINEIKNPKRHSIPILLAIPETNSRIANIVAI